MRWLHATALGAAFTSPLALLMLFACSNGDATTQPGSVGPATQPAPTKFEAGANCASTNDCEPGLVCLFPVASCNTLAVCVARPPITCDKPPQAACSCLGEPIQVCDGYASNPVDPTGTCDGGTVVLPSEGGTEAAAPTDAGSDAALDAAPVVDASDAGG